MFRRLVLSEPVLCEGTTMTMRFPTLLILALVTLSDQHGTKGGSFSGSFSSSSSSSQSSSSSSTSSGSFTGTGSFGDLGLKNFVGNVASGTTKDTNKALGVGGGIGIGAGKILGNDGKPCTIGDANCLSSGDLKINSDFNQNSPVHHINVLQTQKPLPGVSGTIHDSKPVVPPTNVNYNPGSQNPFFGSSGINYNKPQSTGTTAVTTGTCCKGPFPGPIGSIHDSIPASAVPQVPNYASGGSYVHNENKGTTTGSYGQQGSTTSGIYGQQGSTASGSYGQQGSTATGSYGQQGTNQPSSGCCKGPFPGPIGSIHDSIPASAVPQVPQQNQGSTVGSYGQGSSHIGVQPPFVQRPSNIPSKPITGSPGCCKGPFPGPTGSIHDSKPATSVTSGSSGAHFGFGTTTWHKPESQKHNSAFGTSNGYKPVQTGVVQTSYGPQKTDTSFVKKPFGGNTFVGSNVPSNQGSYPGDSSNKNEPIGSYQKPGTNFAGSFSNTASTEGTNTQTGSVNYGSTTTAAHRNYVTGNVIQKPSGTTQGTSSVGASSFGHTYHKPGVTQGTYAGSDSGNFPSSNQQNIPTGNVIIHKPVSSTSGSQSTLQSGYDHPSTSYNPGDGTTASQGIFFTDTNKQNSFGSTDGYATGNVIVHKPVGTTTGATNTQTGVYGAGNQQSVGITYDDQKPGKLDIPYPVAGSGSTNEQNTFGSNDGYATGNVIVQKPGGSISSQSGTETDYSDYVKPGGGTTPSQSTAFADTNKQNAFGSNDGYATGNVIVHKPGSTTGTTNSQSGVYGVGDQQTAGITYDTQKPGKLDNSFAVAGSGSTNQQGIFGSNDGYATGNVIVHKPDGSTVGSDGSYSQSGAFASGFGGSHAHKYPAGSYGSLSHSGTFGGAFGGAKGFDGIFGPLVGKQGLAGSFSSSSGAFAKSHSFAGSSSYAGASAGSYASVGTY